MTSQQATNTRPAPVAEPPWYRQFWPWFIIALPASAVVAGFYTLYLAISQPVQLVVTDDEYRQLNNELKVQVHEQEIQEEKTDGTAPRSD